MTARKPAPLAGSHARAFAHRGPNLNGLWYWKIAYYVTDARGRRTRHTSSIGWKTRADAKAKLRDFEARPSPASVLQPRRRDVRGLLRRWLKSQELRVDLQTSSKQRYAQAIRRWTDHFGERLVAQLTTEDLEDAIRARRHQGDAWRTIAADLQTLGNALRWAHKRGGLPTEVEVPTIPAKLKRAHKHRHTTPTSDEVQAVVDAIPSGWQRDAVLLLWATGARMGEVLALTWSRVSFARGVVLLDGKTGRREFPMTDAVREVLTRQPRRGPEDPVLPCTGKRPQGSLAYALDKACAAADVPRWTPHALRRLAVDRLARSGVDVGTAAALMGHSPEVMLTAYRKVAPEDLRRGASMAQLGASAEVRSDGADAADPCDQDGDPSKCSPCEQPAGEGKEKQGRE